MKNNNIRHIREYRGYSQKYIAKRLGKSQAAISKIENGYSHLSEKAIEQLSKILEVPKKEILDDEFEMTESLNKVINHLFIQFEKNEKLLQSVELNQKNLQEQLNILHLLLIQKTA